MGKKHESVQGVRAGLARMKQATDDDEATQAAQDAIDAANSAPVGKDSKSRREWIEQYKKSR